ncbi:hypothetical protein UA08_05687 [Talaromyces atroroseus]|uniref:DUF1742-domain-containing protein n=1 Tax=Talaromyces atroroseus TaxID=1441469 RepID=A0A225AL14_TALAT|nr:hypothetical protein UA08_05687 [Talaromyces atroroseus]OKL58994.1 hypothetical protein UA08_05687 [Talaromyces atroroseus]
MSLQNVWHLRRVADTASKACTVCYKPSTSVLITPDNKLRHYQSTNNTKDFFYVCPIHLKDRGFCSPIVDEEQDAKMKRDEELAREIENVKREYEEKQKKRKEKEKEKGKEEEDKEKGKPEDSDKNAEKEKTQKINELRKAAESKQDDGSPRIFALHKNFYQMRINRIRNNELAKRNAERLRDPTSLPSVPKGDL